MSCYSPITAYWSKTVIDGRRQITFSLSGAAFPAPLRLPCGKCVGCRSDRARQWAMRCVHESRFHRDNAFITLTYNDDYLPKGGTLVKVHLQQFMRRLRKYVAPAKIRFFACGEYGSSSKRAHYHLLVFGWKPRYKTRIRNKDNTELYTSPELEKLWCVGFNQVGDVEPGSCMYVCGYVTKKFAGDDEATQRHYEVYCDDGEIIVREPEFALMSRRPGIGAAYAEKYRREMLDHDTIVYDGVEVAIPRFYDARLLDSVDVSQKEKIKLLRRREAFKQRKENTPDRRRVREKFHTLKLEHFKTGDI